MVRLVAPDVEGKPHVPPLAYRPDLLRYIHADLDRIIVGENASKLQIFVVYASSRSRRPLGVIVTGSSSAGKSTLLNRVAKYFKNVKVFTRITAHSLDRLQTDLNGYIFIVQELRGATAAEPTLRVWISEGELRLLTTDRDDKGRIIQKEIVTRGVPVFATSTTAAAMNDETQNRLLIVSVDESPEQTKRIYAHQAREFSDPDFDTKPNPEICQFLEALQPFEVMVPYADMLAEAFPSTTIRGRRDFAKLLNLVAMVAFLHQNQRARVQRPTYKLKYYILADIADLRYALVIGGKSLEQSLRGLQQRAIRALEAFKDKDHHTTRTLAKDIGISQNHARRFLNALVEAGYLQRDESEKEHRYYRLMDPPAGIAEMFDLWLKWNPERVRKWLTDKQLEVVKPATPTRFIHPFAPLEGSEDLSLPQEATLSSSSERNNDTTPQMVAKDGTIHEKMPRMEPTHDDNMPSSGGEGMGPSQGTFSIGGKNTSPPVGGKAADVANPTIDAQRICLKCGKARPEYFVDSNGICYYCGTGASEEHLGGGQM